MALRQENLRLEPLKFELIGDVFTDQIRTNACI